MRMPRRTRNSCLIRSFDIPPSTASSLSRTTCPYCTISLPSMSTIPVQIHGNQVCCKSASNKFIEWIEISIAYRLRRKGTRTFFFGVSAASHCTVFVRRHTIRFFAKSSVASRPLASPCYASRGYALHCLRQFRALVLTTFVPHLRLRYHFESPALCRIFVSRHLAVSLYGCVIESG